MCCPRVVLDPELPIPSPSNYSDIGLQAFAYFFAAGCGSAQRDSRVLGMRGLLPMDFGNGRHNWSFCCPLQSLAALPRLFRRSYP